MNRDAEKVARRAAATTGDVAAAGDVAARDKTGRAAARGAGGRRPARRRRADGAASRARILEAAGKLFADQGYDAVSTRALAKAARVNLSAIGYHFGGKAGLYQEVLRQLIVDSEPIMGPAAEGLRMGVAGARGDKAKLAEVMAGFIRHLLGAVLRDERMRWPMALMLREFHQPSPWFPMLLEQRIHPLHNAVAGLVGAATGRRPDDAETRLLTAVLIGQCMALGAARRVVWARLGWDAYTPERVEFIVRTLTPAVLAMFGLPAIDPDAQGAKP
ncbi:MAG: CerR family C-terminal domain-containing protein [Proteobacteria bacterium]|nr:CerR family C-terminal domain-containing protein [Pseudomonadota bacterium]